MSRRYTPEEIVKAITTSDFATGGLLPPANQRKLVRSVVDNSTLLKPGSGVRVMTPSQLSGEQDSVHVHGPVVSAGAAEGFGTGNQSAALSALYDNKNHTFRRVTWGTKKLKATLGWTPEDLAQSIEGASLGAALEETFTKRISHDLEDLFINGNTALADGDHPLGALRIIDNGLEVKTRTSVVTDAAGSFVGRGLFEACFKRLPQHVRRERPNLRWMFNDDVDIDYRALLANRMDAAGTEALRGGAVAPLGIQAQLVPMFPSDLACRTGAATSATKLGVRHGPFIFDVGVNDQIKISIDDKGANPFNLNFSSAWVGAGLPATASGKFTRTAAEVAAVINAALIANADHGTAFSDVATVDPRTDRIVLKSPTTGAASKIELDEGAAGAGAGLDLLGIGKEGAAGVYNVAHMAGDALVGAAAGANSVSEGTFVLLTEPKSLVWIMVVSPEQNGIKMITEYNKDRDRYETIVHCHVGSFVDGPENMGRISNLRTNLTPV